jgi:hypothetical protein
MNEIVKKNETALVATSAPTPMDMIQIALSKGADIDQLQKLMDLQERWEAKNAKNSFNAAMAKFKEDPPTIIKDKYVAYKNTEYSHASHNQVCNAIGAALSKVGITHKWKTDQTNASIRVTCTLTHVDGHSEEDSIISPPDDTGGKNKIQGIASAITYMQRYSLLGVTGMSSADMIDNDGVKPLTNIDKKQLGQIETRLEATKAGVQQFCEAFKISSLPELPSSRFNEAIQAINARNKK